MAGVTGAGTGLAGDRADVSRVFLFVIDSATSSIHENEDTFVSPVSHRFTCPSSFHDGIHGPVARCRCRGG
jgi:hypothetical protein